MINDISREEDKDPVYQNETHTIIFAIIIPLIFFGLCMPVIMIFLDKNDYQKVEDNYF